MKYNCVRITMKNRRYFKKKKFHEDLYNLILKYKAPTLTVCLFVSEDGKVFLFSETVKTYKKFFHD